MPAVPSPPPWTLTVPRGARCATLDNLGQGMRAGGLDVIRRGLTFQLDRRSDPPAYLVPLPWHMTTAGVLGSAEALRLRWRAWPSVPPVVNPAGAEAALRDLQGRAKPANMLQLAETLRAAEAIVLASADADAVARNVSRLTAKLLEWYPGGQMIAWGVNYQHLAAGRPGHMLAAASAGSWGGLQRGVNAEHGALWISGEDISRSQPAGLYLNLINGFDVLGAAFSTLPIQFIFEFGTNVKDEHPLDFLGLRYVHSVSNVHHMSPKAGRVYSYPQPGLLQQDALRDWFVRRFNALADHLIRIENFRTKAGELRPLVMQQTSMTVNRILNVTAHLLASQEMGAQFSDFWDLVDLYGTLAGGVDSLFTEAYWRSRILPAMAALPGHLARLFSDYAIALRQEWAAEVVEGITDPKRRTGHTVRIGPASAPQRVSHEAFFAKYLPVRRNTLHGYDLGRPDQRQFLAIHDGRLPVRLPEWGRLQLIALLANPRLFIERRFLSA